MAKTSVHPERRRQKRFKAEPGAFAALFGHGSQLGQIRDISRLGLSFHCIDSEREPAGGRELKIVLGGRGLFLDKVPVKKITEFIVPSEFRFSSIPLRQVGLQFGRLTAEQQLRLDAFIENHTVGEA